MNFILRWVGYYIAVMFAMSVDNICWIPTSPEYEKYKRLGWLRTDSNKMVVVEGKKYFSKIDYILGYRVLSVLKSWRDIVPAIITSSLMALAGVIFR